MTKPPASRKNRPSGAAGDVAALLRQALADHRAGRRPQARAAYERILRISPEHPDALHMLGVLAHQSGDHDTALRMIERALARAPVNATMLTNLGIVLQAKGQMDAALSAFHRAVAADPGFAPAHMQLGNALGASGRHEKAVAALQQACGLAPRDADVHMNLGREFQALGRNEEAAQCYQRAVELAPGHPSAAFMLASARGERPERAPPAHVQRLFDHYSEHFEQQLTAQLGYSMPRRLRLEFDRIRGTEAPVERAIDLGCGTGLAGVEFRPVTRYLAGVDISPRMVEKARGKNVYDELSSGDILARLGDDTAKYDLFLCADVIPYIGDLEALFGAVRARAAHGARFLFSTELATEGDYRLQATGRYAHSESYLRNLAGAHGFTVITCRPEPLRKQRGEWIMGSLAVLQFAGTSLSKAV